MATLANQTISSTYDGLIKTSTDQPVPISGVQLLEDGVGNSLALSVGRANQGVTVTGTLTATSITGVLADGVTATTQTLGDNSTKVATTAYVDAQVTASDLDFAGDTGTGAVDLDSQTFTIAGTANEIETVASGQTVTIGLPSSVTVGTLSATTLGGTLSTAAQPNVTSVGTLSSLAVSGNLTVDTNTLFVNSSTNRVGIGTSSPDAYLTVDGTSGAFANTGIKLKRTGSLTGNASFVLAGVSGSEALTIAVNDSEKMRITSSGSVGIGTSSPSAAYSIDAVNPIRGESFVLRSNSTAPAEAAFIYRPSTGVLGFGTANTERMRIDSAGRVGIKTSSPSAELEVNGTVYVGPHSGNVNPTSGLFIENSSGNTAQLLMYSLGGSVFQIKEDSVKATIGYDSGIDKSVNFVNTGAGNIRVGIGTSSPNYPLQVEVPDGNRVSFTGASSNIDFFPTISGVTRISTGQNFEIKAFLSDLIFGTGGGATERMRIDSSGNVGIGTSSPKTGSKLTIQHDTTGGSLPTYNLPVIVDGQDMALGNGGGIKFGGVFTTGGTPNGDMAFIKSYKENATSGNYSYALTFGTRVNGGNPTERMRIDSSGNVTLRGNDLNLDNGNTLHRITNSNTDLLIRADYNNTSANSTIQFSIDGSERVRINTNGVTTINQTTVIGVTGSLPDINSTEIGSGYLILNRDDTVTTKQIRFGKNGSEVGSIETTGSTTAYNTSSDYRLKENVVEMTGALDRVDALKPSRFNFIGEDRTVDGFLAHEVAEVVPEAISGEKDAVDEEGNPVYQGIDQSKIVPLLVGAIKELRAEIETLKSQINA